MLGTRILYVTDDLEVGQLWTHSLGQRGFEVTVAGSTGQALEHWGKESYDLIVVNAYTPQLDGVELCRRLRFEVVNPILLLTYANSEPQILEAYEAGADEVIVKPIGGRLFLAKVVAWLRRSWTVPAEALDSLHAGDLRLDPSRRQLNVADGRVIKLTNLEFRLLHLLMGHQGQVLGSDVIIDRVWGFAGNGDNSLLKNLVYRLRRKIEPDPSQPRYLHTLTGEGYSFRAN